MNMKFNFQVSVKSQMTYFLSSFASRQNRDPVDFKSPHICREYHQNNSTNEPALVRKKTS